MPGAGVAGELAAAVQAYDLTIGAPAVEVEADKPRDVLGPRFPGHVGRGPLLRDASGFEDHQSVGEHHRVEGIVGDDQTATVVRGKMPA